MNDVERGLFFDHPEPEPIRSLLDSSHELPSVTPDEQDGMALQVVENLDATLAQRGEKPIPPSDPKSSR